MAAALHLSGVNDETELVLDTANEAVRITADRLVENIVFHATGGPIRVAYRGAAGSPLAAGYPIPAGDGINWPAPSASPVLSQDKEFFLEATGAVPVTVLLQWRGADQ